ncbi:MFS transporter [Candidatus Uhrbacteria bacterium]|nr:MFS transporter [Candidatus Uhrbacteria bacterium]
MNQHNPNSPQVPKRSIWLWASYDFANSLAFVNVSFYFTLWFVQDHNVSDIWVSVPVALSTIVLLFTLPAFGAVSDRIKRRTPFLITFSLLAIASLFLLGFTAIRSTVFTSSTLLLVVILYFLFQYFYQASLAFYSSFIHDFAIGRTKEKLSGLGMAAGQLGNIIGLLLVFPIAQGKFELLGATGRGGTFLIAALLFLLFSLPMLFFLKDRQGRQAGESKASVGWSFRETLQSLRRIKQFPGVLAYLITYYLFADAILTLQLFASLYLEKVGGLDDKQKTMAFILGLLLAVIGALISPWIARRLKSTRRAVSTFIGVWAVFIGIFSFVTNPSLFMAMVGLNGFAFGILFALSRAFYSHIVPPERQGEFFGIYVLFERFASVLGPLVWSMTILVFASLGEATKYRFAMFSLAILVAISFVVFRFVREPSMSAPVCEPAA